MDDEIVPVDESYLSCDIVPLFLFRMNQRDDKFEVARQKIVEYHFLNCNASIHELVDLAWVVSPEVIAWLGRDEQVFSLLYLFVQSRPTLFESKSGNTLGSKRKHSG